MQIKDRFLLAVGDTYTDPDMNGGEAEHTLTKAELPNYTLYNTTHSHSYTDYYINTNYDPTTAYRIAYAGKYVYDMFNTSQTSKSTKTVSVNNATIKVDSGGSNTPHNNMPPYLTVYMWTRTA